MPHGLVDRLTKEARRLPDTDWHVPNLYRFSGELGCTILKANYSRYVVDLNRPPDDASLYPGQATTGVCPEVLFDGTPIYREGKEPGESETRERLQQYWGPYHDQLHTETQRITARHGHAIIYDCHSIRSRVPRLFEGTLPILNVGTAHGASCDPKMHRDLERLVLNSGYKSAINGRFVGGYITRSYGDPASGLHAVQMEIAQSAYMREDQSNEYMPEKAQALISVLRRLIETLIDWSPA